MVSDAAGNHPVAPTAASHGDTGIEVTAAGAMITAQGSASGDPAVVVASGTVDAGQVAAPLALTPTDRHVMVLRLDRWLAPRSAGVTGLPRWTTGNTLEPILDGSPYFARLVPDLRAAKNGGAVGLAGWAFVKDGLLDPSKPWSLLPEDNSTELIPLLDELIKGNAAVRILANQFLQLSEPDLQGLQVDAAVALTLALMLLMPAWAFGKVQFDPIGGSRPWLAGAGGAVRELCRSRGGQPAGRGAIVASGGQGCWAGAQAQVWLSWARRRWLYFRFLRPWHLHWGATAQEVSGEVVGDELMPDPDIVATRVVEIDAPPSAIWPWLVQMGPGRGGAYTYDWISAGSASTSAPLPRHPRTAAPQGG